MIEIKEASPEQFDEIWPIFQDVASDADSYPYMPNISKDEAKAQWFAPNAKIFIAYEEGKPVATRYIVPNKTGLGNHVCNMGVMIDKNYRGRGIGRIMMEFGIQKAKELGFKAIQLNLVVCTNIASIRLCQQYGFNIIGTLPEAFFYKQEKYVDAFVLYKKLE